MHPVVVLSVVAATLAAAAPEAHWAGSFGQVTLMNQGQPFEASAGHILRGNISIATGSNSGAVLFQPGGSCIHVGAAAQASLTSGGPHLTIFVRQGEMRIAVASREMLELRTPLANTTVSDAVVRTQVYPERVLFLVEKGTTRLQLTEQGRISEGPGGIRKVAFDDQDPNSLVLGAGQQVEILNASGFGNITEKNDQEWLLDPDVWLVSISQGRSMNQARNQPTPQPQPQTNNPPEAQAQESSDRQPFNTQISTSAGINLTLGPSLATTGFAGAAISPSDANQDTAAGKLTAAFRGLAQDAAFPGVIHLLTGETGYTFDSVQLAATDNFLGGGTTPAPEYWSIGDGPMPQSQQIVTSLGTGTSINPNVLAIPGFNNSYLVQLDQFPLDDPLGGISTGNPQTAATGLVGLTPSGPSVLGGTAHPDDRARINSNATFALGEFAIRRTGDNPQIAMRRSDQDRTIVKDPDGNDLNDRVTPNEDVSAFVKVPDNRFLPQNAEVFVPTADPNALAGQSSLRNLPTYSNSNLLRQAAFTVLTAQQLSGFSQRTGQTRFVVDGRIIDISGYQP